MNEKYKKLIHDQVEAALDTIPDRIAETHPDDLVIGLFLMREPGETDGTMMAGKNVKQEIGTQQALQLFFTDLRTVLDSVCTMSRRRDENDADEEAKEKTMAEHLRAIPGVHVVERAWRRDENDALEGMKKETEQ